MPSSSRKTVSYPAELFVGERQVLAPVRAYLSPAPLAVLDEATCHLDLAAEATADIRSPPAAAR